MIKTALVMVARAFASLLLLGPTTLFCESNEHIEPSFTLASILRLWDVEDQNPLRSSYVHHPQPMMSLEALSLRPIVHLYQ